MCTQRRLQHRIRTVKRDGLISPVVRLNVYREDQLMVNNGDGIQGVCPTVDMVGIRKKKKEWQRPTALKGDKLGSPV